MAVIPDMRPAPIIPFNRREEGFAPKVIARWIAMRADAQADQPPTTVLRLDEVGVAHHVERALEATVCEDRIVRARLPRTPERSAAGDRLHVPVLGAALCDHQVICATNLVQVRRLWVFPTSAAPDRTGF